MKFNIGVNPDNSLRIHAYMMSDDGDRGLFRTIVNQNGEAFGYNYETLKRFAEKQGFFEFEVETVSNVANCDM